MQRYASRGVSQLHLPVIAVSALGGVLIHRGMASERQGASTLSDEAADETNARARSYDGPASSLHMADAGHPHSLSKRGSPPVTPTSAKDLKFVAEAPQHVALDVDASNLDSASDPVSPTARASNIAVHAEDRNVQGADGSSRELQNCPLLDTPPTLARAYLRPVFAVQRFFSVKKTSAASARDFLARERNFFLWVRLSTLLAVLSASILLQLKLPDSIHDSTNGGHRQGPRKRRPNELPSDQLSTSSKAFAVIFFIMSLVALLTGLTDYLMAERQLETEKVDFDETEGGFHHDGHTTHVVHLIMVMIGLCIIASALWLLST